ncbi:GyrI-like domain-containing protein [Brevibacillus panacihumi]|uniref:GyrI-like domain-containing protein n=1 Tax=Brevibacillus panacihumi TaxID=497735 RepID=UPI003D1D63C4
MSAFQPEITRKHLDSFVFMGKSARTTNEAEMKGEGVIPAMWGHFYRDQVLASIPVKEHAPALALYTNYESDETGAYTFAIGAEVGPIEEAPAGLDTYAVPASEYVVFTTRKGIITEIVPETWQYIWEWSKTNKRAFVADFELYDSRCSDPQNSQVDIYISVL